MQNQDAHLNNLPSNNLTSGSTNPLISFSKTSVPDLPDIINDGIKLKGTNVLDYSNINKNHNTYTNTFIFVLSL